MKKLMIVLVVLVVVALEISNAHAYEIRTVIKSNGVPYTWTSY